MLTCIHRLQYAIRQEKYQQHVMTALLRESKAAESAGFNLVEEQQERKELREELRRLQSQLSPKERTIWIAYFCYQQTMKVIALSQGMTENQVKSVIRRIRRKAGAFFG